MKKSGNALLFLLLIGLVLYLINPDVTDIITKPSARELYERDFSLENRTFVNWKNKKTKAEKDSLLITLPFIENGRFSQSRNEIYSFNFAAKEGHQVIVEVETKIDSAKVFIEVLQYSNDSIPVLRFVQQNIPNSFTISEAITEDALYKIIVQPELVLDTPFQLKIYTKPRYSFPVAGASNKNIQSFWGASRDGGKREHQGNDIFAPRGTPVIAATKGVISSTGNRGLGGKQVWLRDKIVGGNTLYYAHLDSINTSAGTFVNIGDTLGFVGNTGNARTTPPHLHFGIYQGSKGAIDPLPFIKISEDVKALDPFNAITATATRNKRSLRKSPSKNSEILFEINTRDTVSIMGNLGDYLHISAADSIDGFVKTSEMKFIQPN
ncbi:MAG: M23 family metallopeptidase [Patiriisocius sp.]|uniref:M23 family metallopeptidase n=1 Tax=Patiriisocius sp. TaxID=2822396 RepID=UPI003EF4A43A